MPVSLEMSSVTHGYRPQEEMGGRPTSLEGLRPSLGTKKASLWWLVIVPEQDERGLPTGWGCAGVELRLTWAEGWLHRAVPLVCTPAGLPYTCQSYRSLEASDIFFNS